MLRKQESSLHEADLGRYKLYNTRSGIFWETNWFLSVCVQCPFRVEFWKLLAYMTIETKQGQVIFIFLQSSLAKDLNLQRSAITSEHCEQTTLANTMRLQGQGSINCYGIMTFFLEIIDFYFVLYVTGWLGNTYNVIVYFFFFLLSIYAISIVVKNATSTIFSSVKWKW